MTTPIQPAPAPTTVTRVVHRRRPWLRGLLAALVALAVLLTVGLLGANGVFATSHAAQQVVTITPNYGATSTAGSGQKVTFDGGTSTITNGKPLTYTWDFGDTEYGSGRVVTHPYKHPGTYLVTLGISDGFGHTNSKSMSWTVTANSAPVVTTAPQTCAIPGKQVWFPDYAPAGSHYLGPAVTIQGAKAQYRDMLRTRCLDPSKVVVDANYEQLPGYATLSGDQFTAKANELAGNHTEWLQAYDALLAKEKGLPLSDGTMSGVYQTFYAIPQPNGAPLIRQASVDRTSFDVLKVGKYSFKLSCHYQPVSKSPFPGVIVIMTTSPASQPSTPTTVVITPPASQPSCVIPLNTENACSGKRANSAPQPLAPVVLPPSGGYIDRNGGKHTTPYVAPKPTPVKGQAPGQGDSGSGAVNTVAPPTTTAPAAGIPTTTSPSSNPTMP